MIISMIAAMGKNRVIGKDNKMMWRLPDEWAYFKKTTLGHHIITGRKNFEAQGRVLPGRTNIIVTRNKEYKAEGCVIKHSIEEALDFCREQGETEAFICGGGQIYADSVKLVDKIYLTEVDYTEEGQVYFPEFDESKFEKKEVLSMPKAENNSMAWTAYCYNRK